MFFKKTKKIKELEDKLSKFDNLQIKCSEDLEEYIKEKKKEKTQIDQLLLNYKEELDALKHSIAVYNDEKMFYDVGLYEPKYKFISSIEAKEKLLQCRKYQKDMIKDGIAVNRPLEFTYNNSKVEGKKALNSFTKQMLRSFNFECQVIIDKVTLNNIDNSKKKIQKAYDSINKFNARYTGLNISESYLNSKMEELYIL